MIQERGASMIEIIGVLAIAGLMSAAAIGMYNVIRNNQARKIASIELEQIVKNTDLLMGMRGDYTGLSVDYLVSAGALQNANAPIGGDDWSVSAINNGTGYSINLTELTEGECQFFTTTPPKWATKILVNNVAITNNVSNCFSTDTNEISFVVEKQKKQE